MTVVQVLRLLEVQSYLATDQESAAVVKVPSNLRSPADFGQALAAAKASAAAAASGAPSASTAAAAGELSPRQSALSPPCRGH